MLSQSSCVTVMLCSNGSSYDSEWLPLALSHADDLQDYSKYFCAVVVSIATSGRYSNLRSMSL